MIRSGHHFGFRSQRGNLLELAPAIMILLVVLIFPLINLMGVAVGYGVAFLITNQAARQAAAQPTFGDALSTMHDESGSILQMGVARFAKLRPVAGYQNCGTDLYVIASNYITSNVTEHGPNRPVPPPIDTNAFIYEYRVPGTFEVGPMIDMSSIPCLDAIPGLGSPARISVASDRAVEHPAGLAGLHSTSAQFNTPMPPPVSTNSNSGSGGKSGAGEECGWNYPNIYQLIAAAGQTVVEEEVLQVYANNWTFTNTGIDVVPGQKVWIDLRSDGLWNYSPGGGMMDADGNQFGLKGSICPMSPLGMLVGKFDAGLPFPVGRFQLNLAPPGTGRLHLSQNHAGAGVGEGAQTVRIIVTQ